MVATARQGHQKTSQYFNPSSQWLIDRMPVFQDMPKADQDRILAEAGALSEEAKVALARGAELAGT